MSQPSTSNQSQINSSKNKKKNRYKKKNKNKIKFKTPNWLELPEDLWFIILLKLKTIDIIENVQKVCTLFRKICKQPEMFKIIDMYLPDSYIELTFDVNVMTRFAVDCSDGGLIDIHLKYFCDDQTLMYIVERSKNLKHLRLGHYIKISDEGLIEAVKRLPKLEELETVVCTFTHETFEAVGHACPSLKSFSLNDVGSKRYRYAGDAEAFAIARSMPNLRRLQLTGNCLTNEGLNAILDGCCLLLSLDIRSCVDIDLSGDLGLRCERIKNVRCFRFCIDEDIGAKQRSILH
ncbi:hypothetical protein RND81_10G121300 [Saponaria officinalis]|uniref:F-box domain-containing protein n=1 Tax=Saponaria officinalis TaxID=3572 RepID=A0AAW1I3P0_SAPOF